MIISMDKRPEKRTDQEKYLEMQLAMGKNTRMTDIAAAVLLCLVVFGFMIAGFILPDKEWSEQENRMLQQTPSVSSMPGADFSEKLASGKLFDRLTSGEYTSDVTKYLADQFPLRDTFVGLKAVAEISLGKRTNNGYVLSENYIISRGDFPSSENLNENLAAIGKLAMYCKENSLPLVTAIAGKTEDVLTEKLPPLYPTDRRENLWQTALDADIGTYLDLRNTFGADTSGNQLYYRTDHHWTTYGAYIAYREIITALGKTPYDEADFTKEVASDEFYGTTWSGAGMKWVEPDELIFYRYDGDEDFTTEVTDTGKTLKGFYDTEYLDGKDKYGAFLSENNALVKIRGTEEREKLLMIKDSFSHSVAPFLARHYDIDLIDPRYYRGVIKDYIEENDFDAVMILTGMDSLTSDTSMKLVQAGIK